MSPDALLLIGCGVTLVVPREGEIFLVRQQDGAIGRLGGGVVLWKSESDLVTVYEIGRAGPAVLELEAEAARRRVEIERFRGRL